MESDEAQQPELHNGWGSLFADVDDDDDLDYDPFSTGYDSDRLSDASDWDPTELEDESSAPPIHLQHTRALREKLGSSSKLERVLKVLDFMREQGLNLPIFLDALSWGDEECVSNDQVRYARTMLMVSEELPRILERWYTVPRKSSACSHCVRPAGARKALEEFAVNCTAEIIDRELESTAQRTRGSGSARRAFGDVGAVAECECERA